MAKKSNTVSIQWIEETRSDFRTFLDATNFPAPERFGECGPKFRYPAMVDHVHCDFICKIKNKGVYSDLQNGYEILGCYC